MIWSILGTIWVDSPNRVWKYHGSLQKQGKNGPRAAREFRNPVEPSKRAESIQNSSYDNIWVFGARWTPSSCWDRSIWRWKLKILKFTWNPLKSYWNPIQILCNYNRISKDFKRISEFPIFIFKWTYLSDFWEYSERQKLRYCRTMNFVSIPHV